MNFEAHERRIYERVWTYFYRATVVCGAANGLVIGSIYKYSHHPNPTVACVQLMLPLIMWEFLLILSFCPTDIIEYFLMEMLIDEGDLQHLDMALWHLPGHRLRLLRHVHSAGDVTNDESSTPTSQATSNRPTDITESELLTTERRFLSPYLLTQ